MKPSHDAAGQLVDLSNCDREPIHTPGRIQSHGVLFALSEPNLIVDRASVNATEVLGVSDDQLPGTALLDHFEAPSRDRLRAALAGPDVAAGNPLPLAIRGTAFDGFVHRHDGALVLELENPRPADQPRPPPFDHSRVLQRTMARLQAAPTLAEFCQVAALVARDLSGFDRATVYRFDHDWNGEVLAEDRRADLTPLLGLHFPASDIPEQARRLYALNPIRMIADVHARTVPIVPERDPDTGRPLDLSFAILRSVSPVHVQYLKNLGATASMSISLMRGGRLWGLLSCMHYDGPRFLPHAARAACEFLGAMVSVQLAVKEDSQGVEYRHRLQAVRERLLLRMSEEAELVGGLLNDPPDLLELTAAAGAAVVFDGTCATLGRTPDEDRIRRIVAWLRVHADGELFQSDSLPRVCPDAADLKDVAAGLLAVTTSKAHGHWVMWFRPEVVRTIDWGGDPNKPVNSANPSGVLTPRKSFELWKEVVRLKSLPWQAAELEAARMLRDAVVAVVVRRAEDLTRLNTELKRSNTDLDAFAFSASHDLKEPLRGIGNYATFLLEDYRDKLDAEGTRKLETLVRLTRRMDNLIESLLHFSQLGRENMAAEPVDLNEVLRGVLDSLRPRLDEAGAEVRVPRPLPVVRCDRVQIGEVFSNLIANAVKYNDKPAPWVEVGWFGPDRPAGGEDVPPAVFHVRDNGIGVEAEYLLHIFRLFKRLHGRDQFGGGTGVGLALVKKIVERHGGTVWVESEPGLGSTFYFTLGGA